MTLAYSYIRFSSMAQRQGRSQQRQMEACLRWCAKNGVTLSEDTFLDQGKSGYTGEHLGEKGQLRRFIDLVEAGKIAPGSFLIVESLDRLSRQSVWAALPLFMQLVQKGIKIVTLMDGRVYTNENGEQDLILCIFVMIRAHEESETKSNRAKDGWQAAFKKAREEKKPVGKTISNWLRLEDDKYIVIPERAEVVEKIFDQCILGYGLPAIAQNLNREGIPAFRGGTWCVSSVRSIIDNRAVLGEYQPKDGGPVIHDYHAAIISQAKFRQAQAKRDSRRREKTTRQSKKFQLWQGIGVCAACGANMHSVTKEHTYLTCANKRKGLCTSRNVRMDRSEAVFKQMLYALGTRVLVEDDTAAMEKELQGIDGMLIELNALKARHTAALQQFDAPDVIYGLLVKVDHDIKTQQARKDAILTALASDHSGDKSTFLAKIDLALEARDERERANALLKHLKVVVYIGTGYFVTQAGISMMVFVDHGGQIGFQSFEQIGSYVDDKGALVNYDVSSAYNGEANNLAASLLETMKNGNEWVLL